MSILEKWGVYHINRYLQANRYLMGRIPLHRVTSIAIALSFFIGFFITLVIAIADILFFADLAELFSTPKLLFFYLLLNIGLICIEFWFLFHIAFQVIARYILSLQQEIDKLYPETDISTEKAKSSEGIDQHLKMSLVRAVIELNEPNVKRFGLNPYRHLKKHYWIKMILYKLKVILSNFVAKLVARKILSRVGLRAYAPLISTIITGWWDAWVQSAVLKEVRFRIAGRLYAIRLLAALDSVSPNHIWLEALIRLVAVRIEIFGNYNINLDYLIIGLDERFHLATENLTQLFDLQRLIQVYQQLSESEQLKLRKIASQLLAFKPGKLSQLEQQLLSELAIDKTRIEQTQLQFNQLFDYKMDQVLVEV